MKQQANGASGLEYLVDAYRCDPAALRSRGALEQVFTHLIEDLGLRPWPSRCGMSFQRQPELPGCASLTESHITIHTFPETGLATINLYLFRPRGAWAWEIHLADILGAGQVDVRSNRERGTTTRRVSRRRRR